MKKTSEAQIRATKKWRKKNVEKVKEISARCSARHFVRKYATQENMDELNKIFEEKNKKQFRGKQKKS